MVRFKGIRFPRKLPVNKRLRELIAISAPIILEQIFITVMGPVNQLMVANAIGEHAVSAVGLIDNLSNLIIALFAALTTGGTIVVAQYMGKQDKQGASRASAQALFLAVALSLLIIIFFVGFRLQTLNFLLDGSEQKVYDAGLTYFSVIIFSFPILALMQTLFGILRGSGNTGTPMIITIIMNIANVILGAVLILRWDINVFGLFRIASDGFGVAGAAIALTAARFIGMTLALVYVLFFSKTLRLNKLAYFKPDFKIQKIVLGLGIPTSIESSLFQVGRLITQLYIVSMGTAAMFANTVSSSIFNFINVPGNAFATGVMILVGQKIGRDEKDDIENTVAFAIKTGTIMFIVLILCVFLPGTNFLIRAYKAGPESTVFIKQILYSGYIATPLLWALSFITPAALRATGDGKYTMVTAVASMWLVRIGLGYVLGITMNLGVAGVWYAMFTDWFFRGILFYARLKRGKWKNNLSVNSKSM